jgi:glycosyltransferase involved in cell wall biosynthesis
MVTACYKPVVNGVTRMVSLYKQHLESRGHDVTVFTLGEPDPAGDEPGVVRSPAIPLGSSGYYVTTRYSTAAQKLLREMEIMHCHHLFMSADMAHRYGRCPIVYTNHTRYDLYTGSLTPLPQPAADALMRQVWPEFTQLADVIITPSESVRRVMLDFGVKQPIEMIENGIDLGRFHDPPKAHSRQELGIPDSKVLLIYVGRLSAEKGLDSLLEQFAIAQELHPDLHLLLVGSGPLRDQLLQQARRLDVAEHIDLIGAVTYERIAGYLAASDIFVTASVTEVHPLTVIEAMAAGLPVAAISSPGISDTVEAGVTGLLTSRGQGGLAAAIIGLATNAKHRQRMGRAAQIASKRFDIKHTISRTVDLYERLLISRPDLLRKREHGRWVSRRERLQPFVEQLDRLLRPGDKVGTGPLRWLSGESPAGREPQDGQ